MGWDNGAWDAIEASQQKADREDAERRERRQAEREARRLHVVPDAVTTATEALRTTETAIEPMDRSLTPPEPKPRLSDSDPRRPVDPVLALRALLQQARDQLGEPDDD